MIRDAGCIVVSNRSLCKGDLSKCLLDAAKGGADYIMIREKSLGKGELLELVLKVSRDIEKYGAKLIVNSSIYAAKQSGAHAVHLSFSDFMGLDGESIKSIKKFMKLGVSIHSVDEAIRAECRGADYILAGHIFQTDCKPGIEPRGTEFIMGIRELTDIPIFAIGGIDSSNVMKVMDSGANGAAVMSLVMESKSPQYEVERLKIACKV